MATPKVVGDRYWCPECNEHTQLLKIPHAARLVDVNRRTIYRYLEEGRIYNVRVGEKGYRVCSGCLVKKNGSPLKKV